MRRLLSGLAAGAVLLAVSPTIGLAETPEEQALRIVRETVIVDGHIDAPYGLEMSFTDLSSGDSGRDFDYEKAMAGGLDAPFMSIYIPSRYAPGPDAAEVAERLIGYVEQMAATAPGKFALAKSVADVRANHAAGLVSLPMGMENGSPIGMDLSKVGYFHDRGIRYITLTHGKANQISDSSYDAQRPNGGLSDFGRDVVAEMNRVGIMVDVAHISDDAFRDVMETSQVPVIASHSSCRHFTPGFERNMSDEMITTLAEKGGVVMINFGSAFLTEQANAYHQARQGTFAAFMEATGQAPESTVWKAFNDAYGQFHAFPYADLNDVLDHIDRVVDLAGIDHVGLGSDFDGVGDSLPTDLKTAADMPNLVRGLLERGYSEEDIRKILSGNVLRVWQQVEDYAAAR